MLASLSGAGGIDIDADHMPFDTPRGVRQPQSGVAVGCAQLQQSAGARCAHEQGEKLRRVGLDVAQAIEPVRLRTVVYAPALVESGYVSRQSFVHPALLPFRQWLSW